MNVPRILSRTPRAVRVVSSGLAIPVLISIWFIGFSQINPFSTTWIPNNDLRLDFYVYQEFFVRQTSDYFPLGTAKLLSLAEPKGSVLILLPIRILGRVISGREFQVIGMYMFFNLVAQGFFADRLLRKFNLSVQSRIVGVLFLYSPVLFHRMTSLGHVEMSSHYVILIAFSLFFAPKFLLRNWILLIAWCSFLNVYFTAMILTLFVSSALQECLHIGRVKVVLRFACRAVFSACLTVAVIFYFVGYLSLENPAAESWGRLNLFSFLIPNVPSFGTYSRIIGSIPAIRTRAFFAQENEGFSYLGVGSFLMAVAALALEHKRIRQSLRFVWLLLACVVMFIFSLSPSITYLRRELFRYDPGPLEFLWKVFHSPERFSLPLYYLIIVSLIVLLGRSSKKHVSKLIFPLLLAVQILDVSPGILANRALIRDENIMHVDSGITPSEWTTKFEGFSDVKLYPVYDFNSDSQTPGADLWVSRHNWYQPVIGAALAEKPVNFAYLSRSSPRIKSMNVEIAQELQNCKFASSVIVMLREYVSVFRPEIGENCITSQVGGFVIVRSTDG